MTILHINQIFASLIMFNQLVRIVQSRGQIKLRVSVQNRVKSKLGSRFTILVSFVALLVNGCPCRKCVMIDGPVFVRSPRLSEVVDRSISEISGWRQINRQYWQKHWPLDCITGSRCHNCRKVVLIPVTDWKKTTN